MSEGATHQLALDLRNCMRVCLLSSIGWLLACAIRTRPGRCATLMLTDLPTPSLLAAPSCCSCSPLDGTCLTKNSCCNSNHICQRGSQSDALGNCKTVRLLNVHAPMLGSNGTCAARPLAGQHVVSCTEDPHTKRPLYGAHPLQCIAQASSGCATASDCCTKTNVCQKDNRLATTLGSCRTVRAVLPHARNLTCALHFVPGLTAV